MPERAARKYFLRGKLVGLRPLEMGDLDRYCQWMNDPEVTLYLDQSFPCPRGYEAEYVESQTKRQVTPPVNVALAICLLETGEHIGTIALDRINYVHGFAITGAFIGESKYWGQNFGTDAMMLLLNYAFNTLRLRKVCASIKAFNARSLGFTAKCGYRELGRRKQQFLVNGQYEDEVMIEVF
ncbi:MAG: GNAT family protein, partial [Candidatus Komeilibacteria bacterium]